MWCVVCDQTHTHVPRIHDHIDVTRLQLSIKMCCDVYICLLLYARFASILLLSNVDHVFYACFSSVNSFILFCARVCVSPRCVSALKKRVPAGLFSYLIYFGVFFFSHFYFQWVSLVRLHVSRLCNAFCSTLEYPTFISKILKPIEFQRRMLLCSSSFVIRGGCNQQKNTELILLFTISTLYLIGFILRSGHRIIYCFVRLLISLKSTIRLGKCPSDRCTLSLRSTYKNNPFIHSAPNAFVFITFSMPPWIRSDANRNIEKSRHEMAQNWQKGFVAHGALHSEHTLRPPICVGMIAVGPRFLRL